MSSGNQGRPLVLVVEDEFFIAMDLRDTLNREGYRVLGPTRTVAEALDLIAHSRPDASVLDVNLDGESVAPLAWVLKAMNIPFVLASAHRFGPADDDVLRSAENLGKPTDSRRLLGSLKLLLERSGPPLVTGAREL